MLFWENVTIWNGKNLANYSFPTITTSCVHFLITSVNFIHKIMRIHIVQMRSNPPFLVNSAPLLGSPHLFRRSATPLFEKFYLKISSEMDALGNSYPLFEATPLFLASPFFMKILPTPPFKVLIRVLPMGGQFSPIFGPHNQEIDFLGLKTHRRGKVMFLWLFRPSGFV